MSVDTVAAENERLRAFAAEQYDQLLAANAEIEELRVRVRVLEAQSVAAYGEGLRWRSEHDDAWRRLEIVKKALIEAGLIESAWDGSEEDETLAAEVGG